MLRREVVIRRGTWNVKFIPFNSSFLTLSCAFEFDSVSSACCNFLFAVFVVFSHSVCSSSFSLSHSLRLENTLDNPSDASNLEIWSTSCSRVSAFASLPTSFRSFGLAASRLCICDLELAYHIGQENLRVLDLPCLELDVISLQAQPRSRIRLATE